MPESLIAALLAALALPAAASAQVSLETVKQNILDTDQEWVAAEVAGDRATLERILDDGFVATFDQGPLRDKHRFLAFIKQGWNDPTRRQHLFNRYVQLDRAIAVVLETDVVSGTVAGRS